ncbi:hypothetical protein AB0E01_30725 [Nocardia vinacea]|uniref:hypothetical protein n=1 Tax=Nocardia vinacea TaxID=96468 RepID=UPI0033C99917
MVEHDQLITAAHRQIQFVQHGQRCDAGRADQIEQFESGAHVEMVGQFVEDEQAWLLCECPGQQHSLTLTTR